MIRATLYTKTPVLSHAPAPLAVCSRLRRAGSGLQVSYRSYWLRKALEVLYENKSNLSLKDINVQTAIRVEDLSSTLQSLNLIKYWKGDHLLCVTQKVVEDHLAALEGRKFIKIIEDRLRWQPPNTKDTRR